MKANTRLRLIVACFTLLGATRLHAQLDGWGTETDTASKDSASPAVSEGGWGMEENKKEEYMPVRTPYKRFVPPYDSLREIIFYEGVIEDENCETCGADSLYWRARKYLTQRYGKENIKKWIVEDKKADKMLLKVNVPMNTTYGKYVKGTYGQLEYRLTLRFKDGRYKYQFGNFVHVDVPPGLNPKPVRTYHEYYMRVKKGFQVTDKFLMAADAEVKDIVTGLKKSLREPYHPDEDDW
ncbi:MAG: DUF4468 domain-containing protein [Bacteroidetes bacterium]|nr:DUF4468 domain-containing protein [Bacteroidota bacterium]